MTPISCTQIQTEKRKICVGGHTLITLAHKGTYLVRKSEQNANLVNTLFSKKGQRVLSWSKIDKIVLK